MSILRGIGTEIFNPISHINTTSLLSSAPPTSTSSLLSSAPPTSTSSLLSSAPPTSTSSLLSSAPPTSTSIKISSLPSLDATPTPLSSPTTTASMPVSTTILKFELPFAFIACSSGTIRWNYTGGSTSAELTLTVDNNVLQDAPPPLLNSFRINSISMPSNPNSRRQTNLINKTLSSQLDPTSGSFLWPSVNVPQGWYQLLASLPPYGQVNQTSTSYVQEGTDTSCFITSTVIEQNHTGAIVGGTVGGIAFIIGCLYLYCRRRNPRSSVSCRIKEVIAHLRPTSVGSVAAAQLNTPQDSENVEGREINANKSSKPAALALDGPSYSEQPALSTYLRPDTLLESLAPYPNPFVNNHFTPEDPSFIEDRLSPRSSSWSFMAITQPCTRAEPVPYSTQDTGSNHSTFSTALPTYKSRTSTLPPSFHSS